MNECELERYQIFIRDSNARLFVMSVNEVTRPIDCFYFVSDKYDGQLKNAYHKGVIKFKFSYGTKYLDNERTFGEQGVYRESTLHLSLNSLR